MLRIRALLAAAAALLALAAGSGALAAERRLALVIGESAYPVKPLPTAANDAGLIAQTLQAAGFDVTGARDLDEAALKQAFRDFLDKTAAAGPEAVAFVYFSGYGLQLEGENYLVPVDAALARDVDIPMRTLRVSDYLKPLSASGAKLSVVALDAARANPFQLSGQPLAGGLALYEPGGRALLAYNAAPGTIAPSETGDYGAYAHAFAEMIRDGGRPLMDVFENTRLRVSDVTKGGQIPWNSQRVDTDFLFFQREANAPVRSEDVARLAKPISALGPEAGFSAAIRRDTMQGYQDYVATYPAAPYAKRARAILAARREALTWRRSRVVDTPNAYWTYLRRYPKGPHVWDARRRLAELRYELEPPPRFDMIDYDYPPPPPEEIVYVEQPVVFFDDPIWGFAPPPPPPVYLLPPPPPDFVVLPPPVIIAEPYALPAPQYVPIPVWQRAPDYIAPPPDNYIYANAHNSVVVDPQANNVIVRKPGGGVISTETLTAAGVGAAAVAVGAALPNFIAKRNAIQPAAAPQTPIGAPGAIPAAPAPVAPAYIGPTPPAPGGAAGVPAGSAPVAPVGAVPLAPPAVAPNASPPAGAGAPNPNAPVGAPHGIGAPATLPAGPAGTTSPVAPTLKDHALPLPPSAGGAAHGPAGAPLAPSPAAEGALKNHGLPTPAGAPAVTGPAGPGASEKAAPLPAPGAHTPAAAGMPGQALPARRDAAPGAGHQPEQLPSGREPIGGAGGRHAPPPPPVGSGGIPPVGGEPAGPKSLAPGQPHPPAPQGVLGGPTVAPHRAIEPAREPMMRGPAGGQPHMAPSPMREAPGGVRETAPHGMVPPMRAVPNEAMPPRPEGAAAPHVRAAPPPAGYGMPPQMHQMAPPAMHAPPPAPSPAPPAAFMRQPPAPPAARPAAAPPHPQPNKEGSGPHGGGGGYGGLPPGLGGMH